MIDKHWDIAIIGGGIIGATVAFFAANAGFSCIVIDRSRIGFGATGWSGGLIRTFHADPEEQRKASMATRTFFSEAAGVVGRRLDFNRTGYLHFPNEADSLRCGGERSMTMGTRWMNRAELMRFATIMEVGEIGAVFESKAGYYDPIDMARMFTSGLLKLGGAVVECVPVTSIAPNSSGVVVHTTVGPIHAGHVVIAAGPSTPIILDELGVAHDLYIKSIQTALFSAPSEVIRDIPAFTDDVNEIYGRSDKARNGIYVGTPTSETYVECVSAEPLSQAHIELTRERGSRRFPWIMESSILGGLRHMDCYSRHGKGDVWRLGSHFSNILVASGFSGGGFKMAPWAGRQVLRLLEGSPSL